MPTHKTPPAPVRIGRREVSPLVAALIAQESDRLGILRAERVFAVRKGSEAGCESARRVGLPESEKRPGWRLMLHGFVKSDNLTRKRAPDSLRNQVSCRL